MKLSLSLVGVVCLALVACDQTEKTGSSDSEQKHSADSEWETKMFGDQDPSNKARGKVRTIELEGMEIPVSEAEISSPDSDFGKSWSSSGNESRPGHSVDSWEDWVGEFQRVDLVVYDYTLDPYRPLVKDGELHKGVLKKLTVTLSENEVDRLEKFVTGPRGGIPGGPGFCGYAPHHGFVFYGSNGAVLGHLEICLICSEYYSYPEDRRNGLSQYWDVSGIRKFIMEKGLPMFRKHEEWEAFFKEQK